MRPEEILTSDAMHRALASRIESASRGDTVASRRRASSPAGTAGHGGDRALRAHSQRRDSPRRRPASAFPARVESTPSPGPPGSPLPSGCRARQPSKRLIHTLRDCAPDEAGRYPPSAFCTARHRCRSASRAKSRAAHHEGAGTARGPKAKEFPAERCSEASVGIARVAPRRGAVPWGAYRDVLPLLRNAASRVLTQAAGEGTRLNEPLLPAVQGADGQSRRSSCA